MRAEEKPVCPSSFPAHHQYTAGVLASPRVTFAITLLDSGVSSSPHPASDKPAFSARAISAYAGLDQYGTIVSGPGNLRAAMSCLGATFQARVKKKS